VTKCGSCATPNRPEATFCKSCGSRFEVRATTAPAKPKGKAKVVFITVFAALALGAGALLSQSLLSPEFVNTIGASATPTPTQLKEVNSFGVPLTCKSPRLIALAQDFLVQMSAKPGATAVQGTGSSMSAIDASTTGSEMPETSNAKDFQHLDCTYTSDADATDSKKTVYFYFDAVAQPRNWHGSISEQELQLNVGEKQLIYYPEGAGYLDGGGSQWRIWVGNGYFEINTWSAENSYFVILNQQLLTQAVDLLKGD